MNKKPLAAFAGTVACAALFVAHPVRAQTAPAKDAEKTADIRRLMQVTGTEKAVLQMTGQMINQMRQTDSRIPAEFWTRFQAKIKPNELLSLLVPVYEKNYTKTEVKQLLAFYETPLGRKLIATTPVVMMESQQIGATWGRKKAQEVIAEMQSASPKPTPRPAVKP